MKTMPVEHRATWYLTSLKAQALKVRGKWLQKWEKIKGMPEIKDLLWLCLKNQDFEILLVSSIADIVSQRAWDILDRAAIFWTISRSIRQMVEEMSAQQPKTKREAYSDVWAY